jgi:hypothetical protein
MERIIVWFLCSALFGLLPLFVSFLTQPAGRPALAVLERGDAFVFAAAILAPEIGELAVAKKADQATIRYSITQVLLFVSATIFTILYVISTANYSATHLDSEEVAEALRASKAIVLPTRVGPFPQFVNPAFFSIIAIGMSLLLSMVSLLVRIWSEANRSGSARDNPKAFRDDDIGGSGVGEAGKVVPGDGSEDAAEDPSTDRGLTPESSSAKQAGQIKDRGIE